ncbi:ACP S-malonyltransferase [Arthrobacter sp. 35W]|uniref:ACP S-malonyltransferase n=1 Tax=Arthrobacter sp. 35W TaxID=1132441 RepID=UPI0012DC8F75|nr:ACP S-malonyltransferase [Arthrobacter sp. 35W]
MTLLDEAAAALRDPATKAELLLEGSLPPDRLRRQGRIGAGVLAANLALADRFEHLAAIRGVGYSFAAFTGESFGVLSAAVASGALTVGEGVRIAEAFTPLMLLASAPDAGAADTGDEFLQELRGHLPPFTPGEFPVEEPAHVLGLVGDPEHLEELLKDLASSVLSTDVEVHKRYSWRQANVYVRGGYLPRFMKRLERYPLIEATELKTPTTFLAHSARMSVVRDALSSWMASQRIEFRTPHTPVIANHRKAVLTSAEEIRDAVLAMADRIMDSEGTAEEIKHIDPDVILEIGLGNRSVELLTANGVDVPATSWTADDTGVLDAMSVADRFRSALRELRSPGASISPAHLELLRDVFGPSASPLPLLWVRRVIGEAITDVVSRPRRDDLDGLRRFLDLFRHTLAHREDIAEGLLVARSRVKKRLNGEASTLGHAATELEALHPDGKVEVVLLDRASHAESIVFHFEKSPDTSADEIVRAARALARAQPPADRIYTDIASVTPRLRQAGHGLVSIQAAVAFVAHRLALFELLRIYRPSLIAQTDHNLAGSDRSGWLLALAVAHSVTPASIIPLVALTFDPEPWPDRVNAELERLLPEIGDSTIPVLSPDGVPLHTRRELQDATARVFHNAALDRPERLVQLNGACLVVSLGSVLASYRVRSTPHQARVVSVRVPAELWRKGINRALDAADEGSSLVRSHEGERVLRYAQGRKILSSTVNAYIEPGETVIGFGAGGSESMTMFFEHDDVPGVRVRKVLSDALTTVNWDPEGTGVMLPPFAKAQRQAEYLRALPPSLGRVFPQVGKITARGLPVPLHLAADRSEEFRELIYEMSYVPGEEVSRWVERTSPPSAVVARVYEVILGVLHRDVHTVRRQPAPGETLEEQYLTKIEHRLELCRRTAPETFGSWLLDPEQIVINGRTLRNVGPLLVALRASKEFQDTLEPCFHALVMGDTNTENVKIINVEPLLTAQRVIESGAAPAEVDSALQAITADSIGVMFLDPRAIGYRSDGADTSDDPMYDNKPWHNSLGHYDEMHYEQFELDTRTVDGVPTIDVRFRTGNPYQRAYNVRDVVEQGEPITDQSGMEAHFARVMRSVYQLDDPDSAQHRDDPHWLTRFVFTMGTHFTAMPPFHFLSEVDGSLTDTPLAQRRPVAIYAEGIKWLNWALEMLEGTRTEFLGIPVPATGNAATT